MILETILSALGGGVLRVVPEVIGLYSRKQDNSHELALMDKQIALAQTQGAEQRQVVQIQGDAEQFIKELDLHREALAGQMQKTGYWLADSLNFLVRPIVTYYLVLMYGAFKTAMCVLAAQSGMTGWEAIVKVYGAEDFALLNGTLGFYFIGRCFDKGK